MTNPALLWNPPKPPPRQPKPGEKIWSMRKAGKPVDCELRGLLAADTRITHYPSGIRIFRDDEAKIRRTSMGLITGAGLAELIDPVKDRLQAEQITVVDRIIEVVADEVSRVQREPWAAEPRVQESLGTTGWMLTFLGPAVSDASIAVLHLAVLGTSDKQVGSIPLNRVYLLPPTGTTTEQFKEWFGFARDNLYPAPDSHDVESINKNIAHHCGVVKELMRTVSQANEGVAPTFQIGVHIPPHLTRITGIIGPESDVRLDWQNRDKAL